MQPNGSGTSLTLDTSPPATLTSEASPMCGPTTCADMRNAISSPASADGRSPCASPNGPMTDLFGQAPARANPSQPPARARRPMTAATCGLRGFLSSPSADLQSSLESRLRRQLDGAGSTLFSLTWNRKATPAGRPYYQLAASARRTSGSDCGSWPSPCANQANGEPEAFLERKRRSVARGSSMGISLTDLGMVAKLASWQTPTVVDSQGRKYTYPSGDHSKPFLTLPGQAELAAWKTPTAGDGDKLDATLAVTMQRIADGRQIGIAGQARMTSGPPATGSPAQTEKRGQLSPDHSRWLMGYSAAHLSCAPTEMPSCRKRPLNSS